MEAELDYSTDFEGPIRDWIRTAAPALSDRAFFGLPKKTNYPAGVMTLINAPVEDVLFDAYVQVDLMGARLADGGSKNQVEEPARQLRNAAIHFISGTEIGGYLCYGVRVAAYRWRPLAESAQPRYTVDLIFTLAPLT